MTQGQRIPPFSGNEKTSLSDVLKRLGGSALKKSRPAPVPATKDRDGDDEHPMFSQAQANCLVDELLAGLGYELDERSRDFLLELLRGMPAVPGNAFEVSDIYREALTVTIHEESREREEESRLFTMAIRVFSLAANMYRSPGSQPWCDLNVFTAELDRLSAIPSKERSDDEKEYLRFLGQVENSGLLRCACPVPEPSDLMGLVDRFPNFAEPLSFLAEQVAFVRLRGDASLPCIPILLTGPAGIGKTHFAMALAEIMGSRTEVLSMASQSCGFAISGMDRGWSSARPGLVFNALMRGETLSPIIVLDEIDKVSQESKSDPLGPLYTLLEQRSALAFRDEYAGIPVNAGQVFWLATANDASRLPGPLLSRFKVFDIKEPLPEQISSIAEHLFVDIAAGINGAPNRLPTLWRGQLEGHSVRDIRIALQQAFGKAALRAVLSGRSVLQLEDGDFEWQSSKKGRRIGFCA